MSCELNGIKVLVSDYKKALKNYKQSETDNFEKTILKWAKKRTQKSFWNLWGLKQIPTLEEAIMQIKYCINKEDFDCFLNFNEGSEILWDTPDVEEINNKIENIKLIQDNYIWVDLSTLNFINKYKNLDTNQDN